MSNPLPPQPLGLSFTPHKVEGSGGMKSCAVIANSKAGKTTFGASASEIPQLVAAGKKVLILENEAGTASIANRYPNAEAIAIANYWQFEQVVNDLLTKPHPYGVVVLDTFDKFQEYAEAFFLSTAGVDTRAAYGRLKKWTLETADKLHKAPFMVVFLFHSVTEKDERTGMVTTTFALIGAAGQKIGQTFDMIAHLTVENDAAGNPQRVLQLGPKAGVVTGNRWEDILPAKMINATLPDIFAIIRPVSPSPTQQN